MCASVMCGCEAMSKRKRNQLPFDRRGGVVVIQLRVLKSDSYKRLSLQAKQLMIIMQIHWRNDKPVAYGVREASNNIPCAYGTARKAFNELVDAGFIVMTDESIFNSRRGSKTREWRLTWLPFDWHEPTNDWQKY